MTFWGVRGSTPCPCDANRRYGGNTACVTVERPGRTPIILDLGTGLRFYGRTQPTDGTFRAAAFVTHLHWDHVQGLPFFGPILAPGTHLAIHAPRPDDDLDLRAAFAEFMRPPYFPVSTDDLHGHIDFATHEGDDVWVDGARVMSRAVPHVGATNGYRIEADGIVIAYISDHQQPPDGTDTITEGVLELCDGADLVIHDAQYVQSEFAVKSDWGHCTVDYAVHVAATAGARRLALFHHDPERDDSSVDQLLVGARELGASRGLDEVVAAAEGLTVSFAGQADARVLDCQVANRRNGLVGAVGAEPAAVVGGAVATSGAAGLRAPR